MLLRNCAGGLVFYKNKVLILQNEKAEWIFPKGVIRGADTAEQVAVERIFDESGVRAEIIELAGRTIYEFYSHGRRKPVRNRIIWYVCRADSDEVFPDEKQGFQDGGFYEFDKALDLVTYTQDKNLLDLAINIYMASNENIKEDASGSKEGNA